MSHQNYLKWADYDITAKAARTIYQQVCDKTKERTTTLIFATGAAFSFSAKAFR
jgi:hypothetical protein